jgi:hypothetical protein
VTRGKRVEFAGYGFRVKFRGISPFFAFFTSFSGRGSQDAGFNFPRLGNAPLCVRNRNLQVARGVFVRVTISVRVRVRVRVRLKG